MSETRTTNRYLGLLKEYLNTPKKLGVFFSMAAWAMIIRTLLHNYKTNQVIPWVMRSKKKINIPSNHILRYLHWLERLKLLHNRGDCLPKSLLGYRFLILTGANPALVIGFQGQAGHAWIELDGEIINESPSASTDFTPTLTLRPGMAVLTPISEEGR